VSRAFYWQIGKYMFVGLLSAVVDFGIFLLLTRVFDVATIPANLVSVLAAIIHGFFWHKYFTFRITSNARVRSEFSKFFLISATGYIIQQVGLALGLLLPVEKFVGAYEDIVVKIVVVGIVASAGYFANRFWTFKQIEEGKLPIGSSTR
jgi:putative flippase GtrA